MSRAFAARLPDGRVVVGGGFSNVAMGTDATNVDIYNPVTNKWTSGAKMPTNWSAISPEAQTLQDGSVIVVGAGLFGNSSGIYTPSSLGPTVSAPAANCADITHPFAVRSVTVGRAGGVRVAVSSPPGSIVARVLAQLGNTKTPNRWFGDGSAHLSPGHSGAFTLAPPRSKHASAELRTGHNLRVKVTVTFRPQRGAIFSKAFVRTAKGH